MVKSASLTNISSFLFSHSPRLMPSPRFGLLCNCQRHFLMLPPSKPPFPITTSRPLSTTPTPYPLQYELIINRPSNTHPRPPPVRPIDHCSETPPEPDEPTSELGLDSWVDRKLASEAQPGSPKPELDKAKRKYYNKRRKRMYGSDSEDENARPEDTFVELKPEVVEFPTLHRREEELYFYDAFAYPWEKEKHYKMVYQLEKKYFPDQCLDKAFLQPGQANSNSNANENENGKGKVTRKKDGGVSREKNDEAGAGGDDRLVFFEEKSEGMENANASKDLTGKKVEEFFKGLKKAPSNNKDAQVREPFLSSRRTGLPPVWDGPDGTVLLVTKPKG